MSSVLSVEVFWKFVFHFTTEIIQAYFHVVSQSLMYTHFVFHLLLFIVEHLCQSAIKRLH